MQATLKAVCSVSAEIDPTSCVCDCGGGPTKVLVGTPCSTFRSDCGPITRPKHQFFINRESQSVTADTYRPTSYMRKATVQNTLQGGRPLSNNSQTRCGSHNTIRTRFPARSPLTETPTCAMRAGKQMRGEQMRTSHTSPHALYAHTASLQHRTRSCLKGSKNARPRHVYCPLCRHASMFRGGARCSPLSITDSARTFPPPHEPRHFQHRAAPGQVIVPKQNQGFDSKPPDEDFVEKRALTKQQHWPGTHKQEKSRAQSMSAETSHVWNGF